MLCVPNVFIFVTGKEHNIQTNKNIVLHHLKKKKKKPGLTQVVCGLFSIYCLNTSEQK